jgi:hypothetical protein
MPRDHRRDHQTPATAGQDEDLSDDEVASLGRIPIAPWPFVAFDAMGLGLFVAVQVYIACIPKYLRYSTEHSMVLGSIAIYAGWLVVVGVARLIHRRRRELKETRSVARVRLLVLGISLMQVFNTYFRL